MIARTATAMAALLLAAALAACPRQPQSEPTPPTAVAPIPATTTTDAPAPLADSPAAGMPTAAAGKGTSRHKPAMRTGGPLPPRRMPEPVRLNYACNVDADCTVKNVGNCCGDYPACVNIDSPVDAAAVRAQCTQRGETSACGFREITTCACVQQRCQPQAQVAQPAPAPAPMPTKQP